VGGRYDPDHHRFRLAKARGRLSPSQMLDAGAAILSLQLSVLVADIGYSMFVNAKRWQRIARFPTSSVP